VTFKATVRTPFKAGNGDRAGARKKLSDRIKRHVMERVSKYGRGADNDLKGYSTSYLVVDKPLPGEKPMRKPARGWGSPHRRGYKQYRDEIGLVSDRFVFSNMGAAWRDWMQSEPSASGPLLFGFADGLNAAAADEAIDNAREDMLALNAQELEQYAEEYIDTFLKGVWT